MSFIAKELIKKCNIEIFLAICYHQNTFFDGLNPHLLFKQEIKVSFILTTILTTHAETPSGRYFNQHSPTGQGSIAPVEAGES